LNALAALPAQMTSVSVQMTALTEKIANLSAQVDNFRFRSSNRSNLSPQVPFQALSPLAKEVRFSSSFSHCAVILIFGIPGHSVPAVTDVPPPHGEEKK